jgi:DNA-binding transcriptional LysR family regulator
MDRLDCDRMFVAVLETGSFAAAASRLGTSSGQASKLVARLEAELGVRLLNRTTRAVAATEAGQAYLGRIRPLLDEYESLDLAVKNISQAPRGRLRITAPLSFGTIDLAPRLAAFARDYSEIALDVAFTDRLVNLFDEGFDLAIRIGRPQDSSLISRTLCTMRLVLVASDGYLAVHGTPGTPGELAGHECIIDTNFREPERWTFGPPHAPEHVPVAGRLRFSNGEACLAAAEAGLGLAYLPAFVAGPAIAAGRVRLVLADHEAPALTLAAVCPHSRHLAAKVRVLVDFLAGEFRGTPRWQRGW